MEILFTKAMNERTFVNYLEAMMFNGASSARSIYTNMNTGVAVTNANSLFLSFVPGSVLTIIEKVNVALYSGTLEADLITAGFSAVKLLDTLYSENFAAARYACEYLVTLGVLLTADLKNAYITNATLIGFDLASFVKSYDTLTDVYKFSYNLPVELSRYYTKADDLFTERYYLMFSSPIEFNFGKATTAKSAAISFFNPAKGVQVVQSQFIAASLGDIGDGTAEDIEYDYLDVIQYIDSFNVKIQLPRSIA